MLLRGDIGAVPPSAGLLVYTAFVIIALACALTCVVKGRWGYLLAGLVTFSVFWILGALQPPVPTSLLARLRRRHELSEASGGPIGLS